MVTKQKLRDYYCNKKFWYLKIDLESKTTYNCGAAESHRIDLNWLRDNPGELFNTPVNVAERDQMLQNIRNSSCAKNCWTAEDRGQTSLRIISKGYDRTHTEIQTRPQLIDIVVGSDCNLTCSYCCKEFSRAWANDLSVNGDYPVSLANKDRYQFSDTDRIRSKVSQQEIISSESYQLLIDEIHMTANHLKKLVITGGEPFLNNKLTDLLSGVDLDTVGMIEIYTGLGVNVSRFSKILDNLVNIPNLVLTISAENIGKHLEFNRYGVSWEQFETNLQSIRSRGIKLHLHSTITNLTAFGFKDFWNYFHDEDISITFVFHPSMQTLHVMDDDSKQKIIEDISVLPEHHRRQFIDTLMPTPSESDRADMSIFMSEFVKRRPSLDINIYPRSFLSWLGIKHVV